MDWLTLLQSPCLELDLQRKHTKITPNTGMTNTGMIQAILKLESIGRFKIAITMDALIST